MVKSAYHIASRIMDSVEEGDSSSNRFRTKLWKRIWQQKFPYKFKIFAWRTYVNGLPTMQNLNHKGIHCSSFCPLCDKAIETTTLALLHCDHAKLTWAFWHNCPMDLSSSSCDLVDIALDLITKGSLNDLEIFFAIAWFIWWNRNQAIHKDLGFPPSHAWEMVGRVMVEFKAAYSLPVLPQPLPLSKWKAPPTGFFKINTDAAAFDGGGNSCIGVVIRDNLGNVLAASSKVLAASFSTKISEALAMQEGVLLATEMDVSHTMFEFDSLSIIQEINDGFHGGELGHIIRNIRDVSATFTWCSFQHLKREGNRVAHELARVARNSGASQVWKRFFPSLVEHFMIEDFCL
nr:putative ribonuclease h protein [Quercus suber]